MADTYGRDPPTTLPLTPDEESVKIDETSMPPEMTAEPTPHRRSARPDPKTGEVPAGPGDAGLENRPERHAGSPGTKQMSNKRFGIGLGIAALLARMRNPEERNCEHRVVKGRRWP